MRSSYHVEGTVRSLLNLLSFIQGNQCPNVLKVSEPNTEKINTMNFYKPKLLELKLVQICIPDLKKRSVRPSIVAFPVTGPPVSLASHQFKSWILRFWHSFLLMALEDHPGALDCCHHVAPGSFLVYPWPCVRLGSGPMDCLCPLSCNSDLNCLLNRLMKECGVNLAISDEHVC